MTLSIYITIPVYPTESKEKVMHCFKTLLGFIPEVTEIDEKEYTLLKAEDIPFHSLEKLFLTIREQKILDTVRGCVELDFPANEIIVYLHKQALYAGKIAVITSDTTSPLGQVELHIGGKDPKALLDWLAPKTVEGKEVSPTKFSDVLKL